MRIWGILIVVICMTLLFCGCSENQQISEEKVIEISKTVVDKDNEKILNYENPEVEVIDFPMRKPYVVISKNSEKNLRGLSVYRVTYETELDALLGPIRIYIDKYSGEIYGIDGRQ